MTESVIDFPKNSLCPDIWDKVVSVDGIRETYILKDSVEQQIFELIQLIQIDIGMDFAFHHIVGSITSNSYTENADIDLHFLSNKKFSEDEANELNNAIKTAYKKIKYVGKHPIQIYFQNNEFQDLMSVGCYDIEHKKWLVGPEMTDQSFNPYSEYYKEVQLKSEDLAKQIRNEIFSIYESAIVLKKNISTDFGNSIKSDLVKKLENTKELYLNIQNIRKVYSSPASKEQALKYRKSRKWKVSDAAFKLFDKYGYMAILKQFIVDYDLISNSNDVDIEVIDDILNTIKHYINNADKLAEKELMQTHESDYIDEGIVQNISLAILLAIPNILPAQTIQKVIDKTDQSYEQIMNGIENINTKNFTDTYSVVKAINIIARTLFAEARNDGEDGMNAVASVIYNRANGNIADFVNVCKKHTYSKKYKKNIYQFSCWNKMLDSEWLPKNFKVRIPKVVKNSKKEQKMWLKAIEIAAQMVEGKFKPTIIANMYYNEETANPDWGKQLTNIKYIGSHKFGFLEKHAAFI